jgi:hypothetical protein
MKLPLQVLYLEDDVSDAELFQDTLEANGIACQILVFPGGIRQSSISNGCRSFKSLDSGLRPNAMETSLLTPPNVPLGEAQGCSLTSLRLLLRIGLGFASRRMDNQSRQDAILRLEDAAMQRQCFRVHLA